MTAYIVKTVLAADGTLLLSGLPFKAGDTVEVIVVDQPRLQSTESASLLDFLTSLPPGPRSSSSWEIVERQLQAERGSGQSGQNSQES